MKFKICDTHFPAAWVSVEGLNLLRLDSRYYSPQYLKDNDLLSSERFDKKTIGQMSSLVKDGPGGWAFKASEYTSDGVPVIRASDLVNGLDLSNAVYMTEEKHEELKQSECLPGDLVISVRGTPGRAAIVPDSVKKANLNAAVVRVRLKENWIQNGEYITAFLNSPFGRRVTERIANGAVQNNINLTEVRSIPVPIPAQEVQEYIGKKIALSERIRSFSNTCFREAINLFEQIYDTQRFKPNNSTSNFIKGSDLQFNLNSQFYLPRYFDMEQHLYSRGLPVKSLKELLRSKIIRSSTPERTDVNSIPCILTSDIDPYEIRYTSPSLYITKQVYETHSGKLEPLDIVYTSVGPPVGEAALVLKQYLSMAVGGDVSILRTKKELHPGYLVLFLNSIFGKMQNDRHSRGIRQRRVYPENIAEFYILLASKEDQKFIGDRIVQHQTLNELSRKFMIDAKSDVEALIEGKLDTDAILSGKIKAPTWEDIEKELEGI